MHANESKPAVGIYTPHFASHLAPTSTPTSTLPPRSPISSFGKLEPTPKNSFHPLAPPENIRT
jgi:hypothetical protein